MLNIRKSVRVLALAAPLIKALAAESLTTVYARTFEKAAFGFAKARSNGSVGRKERQHAPACPATRHAAVMSSPHMTVPHQHACTNAVHMMMIKAKFRFLEDTANRNLPPPPRCPVCRPQMYLFCLFMRVLLSWFPGIDWNVQPWAFLRLVSGAPAGGHSRRVGGACVLVALPGAVNAMQGTVLDLHVRGGTHVLHLGRCAGTLTLTTAPHTHTWGAEPAPRRPTQRVRVLLVPVPTPRVPFRRCRHLCAAAGTRTLLMSGCPPSCTCVCRADVRAQITEPYLQIYRGILPPLFGSLDFTPLFGFLILQVHRAGLLRIPSALLQLQQRVATNPFALHGLCRTRSTAGMRPLPAAASRAAPRCCYRATMRRM